jgi:hypothetical protein
MRDEMKITVIATGFDKESADAGLIPNPNVMPAAQPRYLPRDDSHAARTAAGQSRSDDLDVPAFIRKKAD